MFIASRGGRSYTKPELHEIFDRATSKCSDPWNSSTSSPTIKLTQKNRKKTPRQS